MQAVSLKDITVPFSLEDGRVGPFKTNELVTKDIPTTSQAAVLSWTGFASEDRLRNLSKGLLAAQNLGFEYLLFDLVSIDQKLPSDKLIDSVVRYSELYTQIPVICSYDDYNFTDNRVHNSWSKRLFRPWVFRECLSLHSNTSEIYYVGDDLRQGVGNFPFEIGKLPRTKFLRPLLHLLCRDFEVRDLYDLRFLTTGYREILTEVSDHLSSNDFLLLCFLLELWPNPKVRFTEDGSSLAHPIYKIHYESFSLEPIRTIEISQPGHPPTDLDIYGVHFRGEIIGEYSFINWISTSTLEREIIHTFIMASDFGPKVMRLMGLGAERLDVRDAGKAFARFGVSSPEIQETSYRLSGSVLCGEIINSDKIDWKLGAVRKHMSERGN